MKKRLLILGMVLAMATATGCGESGSSSADESNNDKTVISEQNSEKDTSFDSEDGKKDTEYKSADDITMDDLMNHEETPATDFEFHEYADYDYITLEKYIGNDPIVVIPDEIDGHKVSKFARIFTNNENIVAVRIGNNVTEVTDGAFANCKKLKYVVFGDSVQTIGGATFLNTDLKELILNEGLQTMGTDDTSDCVYAPTSNIGMQIRIPESVTEMHIKDFSLIVKSGSYAETYAKENNLKYTVE